MSAAAGGVVRRGWQQRTFAQVVSACGGREGAGSDGARMLAVCGAAAEVPLVVVEESALAAPESGSAGDPAAES